MRWQRIISIPWKILFSLILIIFSLYTPSNATCATLNTPGQLSSIQSAIDCEMGGELAECCNIFVNEGGHYVDCLTVHEGINNNFSSDPLFCDVATGDVGLLGGSPCLPGASPCNLLVGVYGLGCSTIFPIAKYINYGPEVDYSIVDDAEPVLFWSYFDTEDTTQVMYQTEVGTDDDWTTAEMWDSDPVTSSDTSAVSNGEPDC